MVKCGMLQHRKIVGILYVFFFFATSSSSAFLRFEFPLKNSRVTWNTIFTPQYAYHMWHITAAAAATRYWHWHWHCCPSYRFCLGLLPTLSLSPSLSLSLITHTVNAQFVCVICIVSKIFSRIFFFFFLN